MISPRIRPRFEMHVPFSASEALNRLHEGLSVSGSKCSGRLAGNHIYLNINRAEQRIWSPQLNLEVNGEDTGAIIHGHFGPRADIWTLVMALYAISTFIILMGLLFAASQWMLGMPVWALWPVGGALLLGITVYILALIGQGLSQDQMKMLLSYVQEVEGVSNGIKATDALSSK
ncbi:MAG: hypothetical protein AB8G77_19895 [Rhodothermales bacterium]